MQDRSPQGRSPENRIAVRFIPKREKLESLAREYPDLKPTHIEAVQALFQLSVDLEKAIDQFHLKNGFSRARYLILMVLLHEEPQSLTPNEIAQRLHVTRGNMTGLIDLLLKDGYVKKTNDKEDRRKVWIEMTPKAHQFLKKMWPGYFKRLSKFMSTITKAELESLIQISRKLNATTSVFSED